MGSEIRIGSMNVRGLADVKKRKDVFSWLRDRKLSIYCLQDVHCTEEMSLKWELEWGFKAIISPFRGDSRGVAILLNNTFEYKLHKAKIDPEGNYVALDIEMAEKRITLINIYGPNRDTPAFYQNMDEIIEEFQNLSIITCGDWNLVQDQELDTSGYLHENNKEAKKRVMKLKEDWDLIDPWRENNPDVARFTWRGGGPPLKQARLDFFLISPDLYAQLTKTEINVGYRTDHSLVTMGLGYGNSSRGRGFWKFNTSLLHDKEYLEMVRKCIQEVTAQYALPDQDLSSKEVKFNIDEQLFFETLKMEIRGNSIAYSSRKKKKRGLEERTLLQEIETLEQRLSENPSEETAQTLNSKRSDLEKLREPGVTGMMIRTRARWVEHGEKPSRYFCNLEKRQYTSKVINQIELSDRTVTDPVEILREQAEFYKTLYSTTNPSEESDESNFFLQEKHINKLNEEQKASCEGLITETEAIAAIKAMPNNKSPGSDGFPVELYKIFWKELGHYFLRSINLAFELGSLSITQKQGVITCLPKGNKPRQYLKNWRPITLLNVDYKILSACLARRMKTVLNEIISPTQKGFLPNRFIGENTRLIYDIATYLEQRNLSGILLLLDFEKAFDSVEWIHIRKCLEKYKFGNDFKKWVEILYRGSESCTTNNGHASQFFKLERGCRQGDPLSPYLFLLAIEPLAAAIKQDQNIKGIKIGDAEYVIGQYADDTFLMLEKDENSIRRVIELLRKFQRCSGLKININKSYASYLGRDKGSVRPLCPEIELQWTTEFTLLGIQFNLMDLDTIVKLNTENKLDEIRKVLQSYKRRNLSIMGKITVVKTMAIPKLVHALSVLPTPDKEFTKS